MEYRKAAPGTRGRSVIRTTVLVSCTAVAVLAACRKEAAPEPVDEALIASGRDVFRHATFGNETFWTDTLRMQEVISGSVDPTTALSVGLKVDAEALPAEVVQGIQDGSISLTAPATTVALLKLGAVVGLSGTVATVNGRDVLTRVGVTCALCHSTVDNSFSPGIGRRLDGWPNHDLDPGAIIALSPALTAAQRTVYRSWGKGMYDARYNQDGRSGPQVIPPAYGLAGVASVTYTGDGPDLAYWNRYVAVTQMHGHGSFTESRTTPPVNVQNPPDSVTAHIAALQAYQLSLASPAPPAGSYDSAAAARGRVVFEGAGRCATCHSGSRFTDAPGQLHDAAEVVSEPEPDGRPSLASRGATGKYRTTPLRGLWQHAPYFHNGAAPTLAAVVDLYDARKALNLTAEQKADLVQYLLSL